MLKANSSDSPDHRESLKDPSNLSRQLSVVNPDKGSMLMNYSLDDFKNSIWENFLGSQVQISTVIDPDGKETIVNQNIDKLGPI